MTREDVQTNLRLPSDLKDRLTAAADAANRSLSAEVAHRLEESFNHPAIQEAKQQRQLLAEIGKLFRQRESDSYALATVRRVLVNTLIRMYEALPPTKRGSFTPVYEIAKSLQDPDQRGLEDALAMSSEETPRDVTDELAKILRSNEKMRLAADAATISETKPKA